MDVELKHDSFVYITHIILVLVHDVYAAARTTTMHMSAADLTWCIPGRVCVCVCVCVWRSRKPEWIWSTVDHISLSLSLHLSFPHIYLYIRGEFDSMNSIVGNWFPRQYMYRCVCLCVRAYMCLLPTVLPACNIFLFYWNLYCLWYINSVGREASYSDDLMGFCCCCCVFFLFFSFLFLFISSTL